MEDWNECGGWLAKPISECLVEVVKIILQGWIRFSIMQNNVMLKPLHTTFRTFIVHDMDVNFAGFKMECPKIHAIQEIAGKEASCTLVSGIIPWTK